MKYIPKSNAKIHKNSDTCMAYEYPIDDPDINAARIVLSGRYPTVGYVVNKVSKELVYVIAGKGTLATVTATQALQAGDMAFILPYEKYYFEGNLELLLPCSPAWSFSQYGSDVS